MNRIDPFFWRDLALGVSLDLSDARLSPEEISAAAARFEPAFDAMTALEGGAIANPDEGRQVGHYWLRAPDLAPAPWPEEIRATIERSRVLARELYKKEGFQTALILGIGGSALGPELVADALYEAGQPMRIVFIDNTDPDGMERVIGPLDLETTVVVVISKSGGTAETRNALVEVEAAYARAEVPFAPRAVAISQEGSRLWKAAEGWRARLPMWDWVGGRTSLTSVVGLFPMFLQGLDVVGFLDGAAAMDVHTRTRTLARNPAASLALAWRKLSGGLDGGPRRNMVLLPYRDRLLLFSRYLQQLVMESLGKEHDLEGKVVHEGLTVYGNKGSTDQHAYVQQLRDGPDDVFVTFLGVLDDGYHGQEEVEPGVVSGDYLHGLLLGTREALVERGRGVVQVDLAMFDAKRLGALIALYERAVGFYASLVGINAYHQPGVEAGKKAAAGVLAAQARLLEALDEGPGNAATLARKAGVKDERVAWRILQRLAVNERGVVVERGDRPSDDHFSR